MRPVLVLRPELGASQTLVQARKRGLDAVAVPLFTVGPIGWDAPNPGDFDALLLTSANAVRHGGGGLEALRWLPVHAVGEATAQAARNAGFFIAGTGDSGVEDLLDSIDPGLKLLHLCGADRHAHDDSRQRITAIPVYRSTPIDQPDLASVRDPVALIHSPRAGRRLAELVSDRGDMVIAAISLAAAQAAGAGWQHIETAPAPTDDALLALAARLCNIPVAQ